MQINELRPTVLVVDDDRLNRNTLAELLQHDCRVLMARDGETALEILGREPVDLVLLDVSMPGMDGYEVLRRIRASEALADLSVIFITARSEPADEEYGLTLGASDFVQKPIRPAVVRARVLTHLKLTLQRRTLADLANRDGLTGIANRRSFDLTLAGRLARTCRSGETITLALFDVDHFKLYNDHYGHGAGDEALRQVAAILQSFARRNGDLAARLGGEEFGLLLTGGNEIEAMLVGICNAVARAGIEHAASPTAPYLTLSGGAILEISPPCDGASLLKQADEMLYRAKNAGRNRVLMRHPDVAGADWDRIL